SSGASSIENNTVTISKVNVQDNNVDNLLIDSTNMPVHNDSISLEPITKVQEKETFTVNTKGLYLFTAAALGLYSLYYLVQVLKGAKVIDQNCNTFIIRSPRIWEVRKFFNA
ncbi:MAG TPA: hypothetical protein VHA52_03475, partial [Candidatus Babeliaceae bacterium]|nr:hypothetical protein [Candidatus Babeliaceae bacterium]